MVLHSNISGSTAGNGVMSAAGYIGTPVGIGRDASDKEREG
jgi:hypothetical protein